MMRRGVAIGVAGVLLSAGLVATAPSAPKPDGRRAAQWDLGSVLARSIRVRYLNQMRWY